MYEASCTLAADLNYANDAGSEGPFTIEPEPPLAWEEAKHCSCTAPQCPAIATPPAVCFCCLHRALRQEFDAAAFHLRCAIDLGSPDEVATS